MILSPEALGSIHGEHPGETVGLRFGCYDLRHAGHKAGIDFAASQVGILVIGVMADEYITQTKGPDRPVNSEQDRVSAIDLAPGVDYSFIVPMDALGPDGLRRLVETLRPDIYIGRGSTMRRLEELGVMAVKDPQPKICSTTEMIESLGREGAMRESSLHYHSVAKD
jgi:cytidyltransferase-like protein